MNKVNVFSNGALRFINKFKREVFMRDYKKYKVVHLFLVLALIYVVCFSAEPCFASLESSLLGIKSKLTGFVLPVVSVMGLLLAGFSFMTGSEKAKQHIVYAVIGCIIGFGAQAIVDFLAQTVN